MRYLAFNTRRLRITARSALVIFIFCTICLLGCDSQLRTNTSNQPTVNESPQEAPKESGPKRVVRGEDEPEVSEPVEDGELSAQAATNLAWQALTEAVEYQPVLAVWIVDRSPSAQQLTSQVSARLKHYYSQEQKQPPSSSGTDSAGNDQLQTAIIAFADEPQFVLDTPAAAGSDIAAALDSIPAGDSEEEHTFAAIQSALEKYSGSAAAGRSVFFFVISDEAGEDWSKIDELLPQVQERGVTVFAIGSPAPFGRTNAGATMFASANGRSGGAPPPRYGPETRATELVRMDAPFQGAELAVMDSGFGPFGLEYLCRSSGGVFLAVRPKAVKDYVGLIGETWPSPYAKRFSRDTLRSYAPDFISESDYQALLKDNAAANALHEAAKLESVPRLIGPQLEFVKRDEAQFGGDLSKAQQVAASLAPGLTRMYDLLKAGEAARPQLTSRRWQAAFDLAIGQVSMNKVRVDGYNAMLARAKRGMTFQNAASMSWLLEPAEEHADSSLEKIAQRGRESLERVVREHPNTPWAALAELELKTPSGWKWTER